MKKILSVLFVIVSVVISSCSSSEVISNSGKSEIEIYVIDKSTKKPIPKVQVTSGNSVLYTNMQGKVKYTNLKGFERTAVTVYYTTDYSRASKSFMIKAVPNKLVRYTVKFKK